MDPKELETVLRFMEHTDKINKRLTVTIIAVTISLSITIMAICAFYFFADYQYPQTEQQASSTELHQSIK